MAMTPKEALDQLTDIGVDPDRIVAVLIALYDTVMDEVSTRFPDESEPE